MAQFRTKLLPWCGNAVSDGFISFPFDLSQYDMMRWAWRVRYWRIEAEFDLIQANVSWTNAVNHVERDGAIAEWAIPLLSEREIQCVGYHGNFVTGAIITQDAINYYDSVGDLQTATMDWSASFNLFTNEGFSQDGAIYRPTFVATIGFSASVDGAPKVGEMSSDDNHNAGQTRGSVTVEGQSTYLNDLTTHPTSPATDNDVYIDNAQITITPLEYWEYRPTAGGAAIFDSADGSKISPNVVNG